MASLAKRRMLAKSLEVALMKIMGGRAFMQRAG